MFQTISQVHISRDWLISFILYHPLTFPLSANLFSSIFPFLYLSHFSSVILVFPYLLPFLSSIHFFLLPFPFFCLLYRIALHDRDSKGMDSRFVFIKHHLSLFFLVSFPLSVFMKDTHDGFTRVTSFLSRHTLETGGKCAASSSKIIGEDLQRRDP